MGIYAGHQVIDYLKKHGFLSSPILGVPHSLSKSYNFWYYSMSKHTEDINRQRKIKHIYLFIYIDRLFSDYISCSLML
jgi:hypothetical protein